MIFCALIALCLHPLVQAEFPVGGGNAQRSGFVDADGPVSTPKVFWERPLGIRGGISDTQPVIDAEGNIYATASPIGSEKWDDATPPSTVLVSFRPDGSERWRYTYTWNYTSPAYFGNWSQLSGPVVVGNTVVIGHRFGVVRGVDRRDGSIRWTQDLSPDTNPITSTPVADRQGFVYYHCKDIPTLHKINAATGEIAWTHHFTNGGMGNTSSPTLSKDEKTLYIGRTIAGIPNIYAINTGDGSCKWVWNADPGDAHAFAWSVPALGPDGTLYVQDEATAKLYGLIDGGSMARLRSTVDFYAKHAPRFGACLPAGYVGQFEDPSLTKPVVYLARPDGVVAWRAELEAGASGGLVACRNAVYLGMNGTGMIWSLDSRTGDILWSIQAGSECASFSEGITLSKSGVIYAGVNGTPAFPDQAVLIAIK